MRVSRREFLAVASAVSVLPLRLARADGPVGEEGFAMHGSPKYGPGFTHFDYADPNAPRGGRLTLGAIGTFDSLNPFILKGDPASGMSLVFDTLTVQSNDEPFTEYGLIAQAIEVPEDRSWVAFELRPEARWQDGTPITVDDVIWSMETLRTKGAPFYRAYYANVKGAEAAGPGKVRFVFDGGTNRELPLIIGQMPVLPKHWWEGRDFERSSLDILLGSGPYKVKSLEAGRTILYERDPAYWGAKVPVMNGRYNFDEIRYDYYRDPNVLLEAFKAGQLDLRIENSSRFWATGYQGPALDKGLIVKEEIEQRGGGGVQGFVFNIRRPIFKDPRVREALGYAFDFEWTNKTLFYDAYVRTRSYFENTELAATGLPSPEELALLEPFRGKIPDQVFTEAYAPPVTDGSGNNRENLRKAVALFKAAGWEIKDGKLVETATGTPMAFELMLDQGGLFERISGPFVKSLERLGVTVTMRSVDDAQYQRRVDNFDFDMITNIWGQSVSPGNEQRDFWGSAAADMPGSRNLIGIKDPVVDALIDRIIQAPSREDLVAACRALDRVLQWSFYIIPHWYNRVTRVAYWDKFGRSPVAPQYGLDLFAWWIDPAKAAQLAERRKALGMSAG
ncbi:MAG: extracellular solute-binding protein [Geminicoccaceae bacterium]